ncbi:MAG: PhzF family phenazine biosynthesis protein [Thermodesulfovibrionales bacterium]|nr:PhzF family phenazine biosynthesis protein [Thermodesulfovibrionales bacterium]
MHNGEFMILDVFSSGKFTGNPLAVVMAGEGMTDSLMQSIALEMNYSETTFITGGSLEDGFDVRIFTPASEIPFAGHPVLGTSYVCATELSEGNPEAVSLNLEAISIDVTIEYIDNIPSSLTMRQSPPEFGQEFSKSRVAEVLGLDDFEIEDIFPVQEVSTGLPFVIVPVTGLDAMGKITLETSEYYRFISDISPKALLPFCLEAESLENHVHVRMFAPYYGISEDPATGSGGGCLAAYLLKHAVLGEGPIRARAEQGVEMGRPSVLELSANWEENGIITVRVGGQVVPTARGILL